MSSVQLTVQQAISRAKKAIKKGNTAEALELYTAVLKHQPHHSFVKKELAKLQKGLSKNQSIKAASLDPPQDQATALVNLYKSGHVTEAEQTCRGLLQTYPQSIGVMNILGAALKAQGKLEEALQVYENAVRIDLGIAEIYHNYGNVLKDLGRVEDALESYDKAIQVDPDYTDAYYNRGTVLKDIGRMNEAVDNYDKAIAIEPGHAKAHNNKGLVLKDLGRLDEALESYDRSIQLSPDYSIAHANKGLTLRLLDRWDAAIESYRRALEIDPAFELLYMPLSEVLLETGQHKEGLRLQRIGQGMIYFDTADGIKFLGRKENESI